MFRFKSTGHARPDLPACIGWETDEPCPVHGQFHGCNLGDGHSHTLGHRCDCGAYLTVRAPYRAA